MDSALETWLNNHNIHQFQIIEYNPWKGRYCLLFDYQNKKCFLKWNDSNIVHSEHKKLLLKELAIYKILKAQQVTPIFFGGEVFLTQYIDNAETLRCALIKLAENKKYETFLQIVQKTFETWNRAVKSISISNVDFPSGEPIKLYRRYLRSLLCSGPINTKANKFLTQRNTLIYFLYRIGIDWRVRKVLSSLNKSLLPIVHGDFHANNVLVDNDLNVYIIDYENVGHGVAEIEIAYMYSQIRLLCKNKKELLDKIDLIMKSEIINSYNMVLFDYVLNHFNKAIKLNNRFC